MKKIIILLIGSLTAMCLQVQAQQAKDFQESAIVTPYRIRISNLKTTMLLFPSAIKSVDRGSRDILAERVAESENALKLKAGRPDMNESDLSVITADGRLFSFIVSYSALLPYQAIDLRQEELAEKAQVQFKSQQLNLPVIRQTAASILGQKDFLHVHTNSQHMRLRVQAIYQSAGMLYFKLSLINRSNLPYGIDFCRFYSIDNKKVKRTAEQESDKRPVYSTLDTSTTISGKQRMQLIYVVPQFTISDGKHLVIEIYERGGDRKLSLAMSGKEILKARPVNGPVAE
ncbi:MAG: conjugative transposon protein TraN [Bacteroidetes bacterium]|nr:conjugative transposon protein TraN [Bacteroidota bacterium]